MAREQRWFLRAIHSQLAGAGVIISLFVWILHFAEVDCGWRTAPDCAGCNAAFKFECLSTQCVVLSNSAPPTHGQASATSGVQTDCCEAVILTSSASFSISNAEAAFGGYHLTNYTASDDGIMYERHGVYLFRWATGGEDFSPGWRFSLDYRTQTSVIRQQSAEQVPCPSNVSSWELFDGTSWLSDDSVTVTCAQPLPPLSTCVDVPRTSLPLYLGVWGIIAAIGSIVHLSFCVQSQSASKSKSYFRQPEGSDGSESTALLRPANVSVAVAVIFAALSCAAIGWLAATGRRPGSPPVASMWLAVSSLLLSGLMLRLLVGHHKELEPMRRLQPKQYGLYVAGAILILLFVGLLAGLAASPTSFENGVDGFIYLILLVIVVFAGKLGHDHWSNRLRLSSLQVQDDRLADAFASGAIRLVDAAAIRAGRLRRIERRQALEAREAGGERLYLSTQEAVAVLKAGKRQVGFLTYGWRTAEHPDPDDKTIAAVSEALASAECQHIQAIFWDMASLWQKPRSAEQEAQFKLGLKVMADGYASPIGVTVLRCRAIPPIPTHLLGRVVVHATAGVVDESQMRSALVGSSGRALSDLTLSGEAAAVQADEAGVLPCGGGRWLATFASHAQAAEAVDELSGNLTTTARGISEAMLLYNDRPYDQRGWCVFESAVSTEALMRIEEHRRLNARLVSLRLPPKLLEIDSRPPTAALKRSLLARPMERVEKTRDAVRSAAFTGRADRDQVLEMLDSYVDQIATAMYASGEGGEEQYSGEQNAAGQREGSGTLRHADGSVYEGGFLAGKMHGRGHLRAADKTVYEGEWKEGQKEGPFLVRHTDGRVTIGRFCEDELVGRSARWSADRNRVWTARHKPAELVFDVEVKLRKQWPSVSHLLPALVITTIDGTLTVLLTAIVLPFALAVLLGMELLKCVRFLDHYSETTLANGQHIANAVGLSVP